MKKIIAFVFLTALFVMSMPGLSVADEPVDVIKANVKERAKAAQEAVPSISVTELKKIMENSDEFFELIDVRTQAEYDAGRLADAIFAPRGKAEWVVPNVVKDPDVQIYVYCKAGARGAFVTQALLDIGYTKVTNVAGGFRDWAKAGYPFYNEHGKCVVTKDGFGKKPE